MAHDRQGPGVTSALATVMCAGLAQELIELSRSPPLLVFEALLTVLAVAAAVQEWRGVAFYQRATCIAIWLGNFVLCMASMGERPVLVHLWGFVILTVHQYKGGQVLPWWATMLLGQIHAVAHWLVQSRYYHPTREFLLTQLTNFILPAALLHCLRRQPSNTVPPTLLLDQPGSSSCKTKAVSALGAGGSEAEGAALATSQSLKPWQKKKIDMTQNASIYQDPRQHYPTYRALLGDRHRVCIKIATSSHPSHIRPGGLDTLARSVKDVNKGLFVVLGASARFGCILISLDARDSQPLKESSTRDGVLNAEAAAQALACAKRLLPVLQEQLGLHDGGACGTSTSGLEPGQYLSLQLGNELVYATYNASTQSWVFTSARVTDTNSLDCLPQLCLAMPSRPAAQLAVSNSRGMYAVAFQVHVSCSTLTLLPAIVGSTPGETMRPARPQLLHNPGDADASGSDSPRKPTLQLWVHCQGQYLQTSMQAPATGVNNGDCAAPGTLQAVVQLPEAALARHHLPDGPVARLQMLTAELWDGDSLLSSTSLLLDAEQHLSPAPACSFGWWGASPTAAAGMVHELMACAQEVHAFATDDREHNLMQSHEAFVSDLAAWLTSMQHAAPVSCCDMVPFNVNRCHGLEVQTCQALFRGLQEHAAASHLPHTVNMLQSQNSKLLSPWLSYNIVTAHIGTGVQAWAWFQQLTACAVCTVACPACEFVFFNRLHAYLRHMAVSGSTLFCLGVCAFSYAYQTELGLTMVSCFVVWAALHLTVVSVQCMQPKGPQVPHSLTQRIFSSGVVQGVAWVFHILLEGALMWGQFSGVEVICRFPRVWVWIGSNTLNSIVVEQVHTWGRWPAWLVRGVMLLEAVVHLHVYRPCTALPRWAAYGVFGPGAFLLPLMLQVHWRRMLKSNGGSKGSRTQQIGQQTGRHTHSD